MSVQPVVQVREAESTGGEGGKVPVMGGGGGGGGGTSYQYRKVLNRQNADSLKIIHDIPRSKFTPGCLQNMCKHCSCSCCGSCSTCCKSDCMENVTKARKESTYTWVMENRIEFNRPMIIAKNEMFAPCLCKFRVLDNIRTVHYDDDMYDYIEVKDTQCFLVTMCCGTPGERISFRRAVCGCPSAKKCGMEVASLNVTKGEGVKTLQIIMAARDNARAKME